MNDNDYQILWEICKEDIKQASNHEASRIRITGLILVMSGALMSIAALDNQLDIQDLPLALFIVVLGAFGMLFSWKYYERFTWHYQRYREFRDWIAERNPDLPFQKVRTDAEEKVKEKWLLRTLGAIPLNSLWAVLNGIVSLIGLFIVFEILVGPFR